MGIVFKDKLKALKEALKGLNKKVYGETETKIAGLVKS
jgi:hypothetical protein